MRFTLISIVIAAVPLLADSAGKITLDVVVKDKKGAAVRTAQASQFTVTDNGEKQSGVSVKLVEDSPQKLVTLAFTEMGNEERRLAKQNALNLLKESKDPTHLFSVVMLSNQISFLQPFTADKEPLRKAIELATSGALNTRYSEVHDAVKKELLGTDNALARVQLRMMSNVKMAGDEGPRRTIIFLDSLARGLSTHPGRKALAYFTWGMFVPSNLDVPFLALQARANRGSVSVYGIDCRGVQVAGQNSGVQSATASAAVNTSNAGLENTGTVNFLGLDSVQDSVRLNLQSNLRVLAEATGGLFVGDTNDARGFFRQMLEDISSYYELTYDPGIKEFDGTYRKTSVKIDSKDLRVRDRDGYFALTTEQGDLLPYEFPLLKALTTTPAPREVEFRSGAIRLGQLPTNEVNAAAVLEVPLRNISFKEDATTGTYSGRLTMLLQVKDATGKVVEKYSRDLPLKGKVEQLEALKNSNFSFKEQFAVAPGRYILEAVVADQGGAKLGARRSSFQASAKKAGIGISSVSVVRNFQPNAKDLTPDDPFQFQGGRITPTLTTTLKQVKDARMALFFTIYPDKASTEPVQAVVQYLKEGTVVGNAQMPLPPVDAMGRIPYVLNSPIDSMPAGTYEIKVQVKQGASAAEESVLITIES